MTENLLTKSHTNGNSIKENSSRLKSSFTLMPLTPKSASMTLKYASTHHGQSVEIIADSPIHTYWLRFDEAKSLPIILAYTIAM